MQAIDLLLTRRSARTLARARPGCRGARAHLRQRHARAGSWPPAPVALRHRAGGGARGLRRAARGAPAALARAAERGDAARASARRPSARRSSSWWPRAANPDGEDSRDRAAALRRRLSRGDVAGGGRAGLQRHVEDRLAPPTTTRSRWPWGCGRAMRSSASCTSVRRWRQPPPPRRRPGASWSVTGSQRPEVRRGECRRGEARLREPPARAFGADPRAAGAALPYDARLPPHLKVPSLCDYCAPWRRWRSPPVLPKLSRRNNP